MRIVITYLVLGTMLTACGLKGDLMRPSDIPPQERQEDEQR